MGTPRLTTLLAVCFGLTSAVLAGVLAVAVTIEVSATMRSMVNRELHQASKQAAVRTDRYIFERWNDLKILADTIRDADDEAARRAAIERVMKLYKSYRWIGYADTECRVLIGSDGLLENRDASTRSWCSKGRDTDYFGGPRVPPFLSKINNRKIRVIDISVPVYDHEGNRVGVVVGFIETSYLYQLQKNVSVEIAEGHPTESYVVGQDGHVIAGPSDCNDTYLSHELMDEIRQPGRHIRAAWPDSDGFIAGAAHTAGFDNFKGFDWYVVTRGRESDSLSGVYALRNRILLWGGLFSLLSALLAVMLARWIGTPLHDLAQRAALGNAHIGRDVHRRFLEIRELTFSLNERFAALNETVEDLRIANERTNDALDERERLLKEVHHRVKNNLQVIISTMRLQGSRARNNPNGQALVTRITNRVQVLGALYSKLYERAIFENIRAIDMLTPLIEAIRDTYPTERDLNLTIDATAMMGFDQTLVLGMLAIEIVTNAIQHTRGPVVIQLVRLGDQRFAFTVEDQGGGFDSSQRFTGIGLTLSQRMAQQLGGQLVFETVAEGTLVRVEFELEQTGLTAVA